MLLCIVPHLGGRGRQGGGREREAGWEEGEGGKVGKGEGGRREREARWGREGGKVGEGGREARWEEGEGGRVGGREEGEGCNSRSEREEVMKRLAAGRNGFPHKQLQRLEYTLHFQASTLQ